MESLKGIKSYAATLGLKNTHELLQQLIHTAEQGELSYVAFLENIFGDEVKYRQDKAQAKRIREAGFPYPKYLKDFDLDFCLSITPKQLNELAELTWIDGLYNLILSGPPGVGNYRKFLVIERFLVYT
jgi:DNA replication protein DnaC